MLFRTRDLEAIRDGRVGLAFRRWRKPSVRPGGTVRTAVGLVGIDSIEQIDPATLSEAEAIAANYPSLAALQAMFASQQGTCYRIRLHYAGPDPREALREQAEIAPDERKTLDARLDRLDKAAGTPWTRDVLALIGRRPGVVSTELAAELGAERFAFKDNVRKLKALGLTESLATGYRLSARGEAYLRGG